VLDLSPPETLRAHDPKDLISKIARCRVRPPEATSELWGGTVRLAMQDDPEMVGFLQRVFGLLPETGAVSEDKFFVWFGPTADREDDRCRDGQGECLASNATLAAGRGGDPPVSP